MNFLVVGHSVVDKISDKNRLTVKPGGIFYTAVSLFNFLGPGDNLYLCTSVDDTSRELFSFIYDKLPQTFIQKSDKIPSVQLKVKETGEREEKYENLAGNLNTEFTREINFDGILVNMITGFDISVEQLERLRKSCLGIIYFDAHTLSRDIDNTLNRNFRKIPDFERWAACVDILQSNEAELRTLTDKENEKLIVEQLLGYGIEQVIVTKADRGASVYFEENGTTEFLNEKAIKISAANTIGCGDVFGAVYFYNYITRKNVKDAFLLAGIAAGVSTNYINPVDYLNLREDVRKQLGKK